MIIASTMYVAYYDADDDEEKKKKVFIVEGICVVVFDASLHIFAF
jgi:hypothetical protein